MFIIVLLVVAMLVSFLLLARICDIFFVSSLDKISRDLKLSSDAAGATLMAIGSSAPELFVSLFAVIKPGEHQFIGIGSIVGSALFNLLVITGVVALVRKTVLEWKPILRDVVFYIVAVGLLLWALSDRNFTLMEATVFLVFYIVYVFAVVRWRRWFKYEDNGQHFEEEEDEEESGFDRLCRPVDKMLSLFFPKQKYYYWVFGISIAIIAALSWVLVESAVYVSEALNIPGAIIGLTVLAIGTSIPDLFSSIIVAKQGRGEMAVSNAIGSNIFDVLIGLGLPFMIFLIINGGVISTGEGNLIWSSALLFVSAVAVLIIFVAGKWKIGLKVGVFLILLYLAYLVSEILKL